MREFEGRVAVVTGAASGMGRAFAERFARAGMKVVLADVEERALERAVQELRQGEFDVLGVRTDVARAEAVEELARRALDAYGKVHVVCNNAGVVADADLGGPVGGRGLPIWELSLKDWHWTFAVNFWGVVHGIRTFVPIMLRQDEEGHVVNTASIAGLTSGAGLAIYGASKHAVVRITEALHLQLAGLGAKVKASVLCPGGVNTRIALATRNRPDEFWDEGAARPSAEELERREQEWAERTGPRGMRPEEVAERVFRAIQDEQFYILTHDEYDDAIRRRMETILARENPQPRPF
jgi:NAD(P)-dependent dehydrogenase (short-subunit alcohol dehydrogenase family)